MADFSFMKTYYIEKTEMPYDEEEFIEDLPNLPLKELWEWRVNADYWDENTASFIQLDKVIFERKWLLMMELKKSKIKEIMSILSMSW